MSSTSVISPQNLHDLLETKQHESSVLDVRTAAEFADVHAASARNVPLDGISVEKLSQDPPVSKEGPVYLLCERGSRATIAAAHFIKAGFTGVFVVEGGTRAWIDAGLPVIRGTRRTISIERQVRIAAGTFVLAGIILGFLFNHLFFGLSAFVGAGLVFAGITDWCGMGLLLARAPWNR